MSVAESFLCPERCVSYVLKENTVSPTIVKKDRTECAVLFALTLRSFFAIVVLVRTRSCSWAPAE